MINIEKNLKNLENLKITSNTSKILTKKSSLPATENTKNNTPKEKCEHNDILWLTAC